MEEQDCLLTVSQAAQYLKLSMSQLNKLRMGEQGPRFHKFGHVVRYALSDLRRWAASHARNSTREAA